MALPATDDFTTGTDQDLSARTNWSAAKNDLRVVAATDDVRPNSGADENACFWDGDSFNDNHYSQGTISAVAIVAFVGLAVRAVSGKYYGAYGDTQNIYLFKEISGSWTQLDTKATGFSVSDDVYLEAAGTDPSDLDFQINSTSELSDNADGALDTGSAGVSGYSNFTTTRIDDWEGGNLGPVSQSDSITANATVKASESSSFTANSIVETSESGSFSADADITSTSTVQDSFDADADIVCVGTPVWVSPADTATINSTPTYVFTIPWAASNIHFELLLDTVNTFDSGNLRRYVTEGDQSNWEYWDGGDWQPFPSAGVSNTYAGNNARFSVVSPLSETTWYRKIRGGLA